MAEHPSDRAIAQAVRWASDELRSNGSDASIPLCAAVNLIVTKAIELDAAPSEPSAEAADELARLRAEVERLDAGWKESIEVSNRYAEQAGIAERERDELRRRIAEAPAFTLTWVDGREWRSHDVPDVAHADISGQRVALVRLDAEEGK